MLETFELQWYEKEYKDWSELDTFYAGQEAEAGEVVKLIEAIKEDPELQEKFLRPETFFRDTLFDTFIRGYILRMDEEEDEGIES